VTQHRWEQRLWTCVLIILPLLLWLFLVRVIGVESDTSPAEASRERKRRPGRYESLRYASILVIVSSVDLYGEILTEHVDPRSASTIFSFSIGLAIAGVGVGTCAQIFVRRGA
jgi:hypothetical protein